MNISRRCILLALLAATAVVGCTIEMPDLVVEVAITPIPGPTFRSEVRVSAARSVVYHGLMVDDEPIHAIGHGVRFDAVIVSPGATGRSRRLLGTLVLEDSGQPHVRPPSERSFAIDEVLDKPVLWSQLLTDWTSISSGDEFHVIKK